MKKSKNLICLLMIVVTILFSLEIFYLFFPTISTTISSKEGVTYYLRPGTSKKTLVKELSQQRIIRFPRLFSVYMLFHPKVQLKTGEYLFPQKATPISIWNQVINGTGFAFHPFTIVPGWTFSQLQYALLQTPGLRHLSAKLDSQQLMAHLGYSNFGPEGEFFPETYYYTRGILDLVILKRAIDLMQLRLKEAWTHRAKNLPYKNVYEALITASIIEKEAFLSAERPIIAGVIVNRLKKNMLLQCDPTVIYGLASRYNKKIHKEDLLDNNPYNTYLHKGLPPTPIAIPSMLSITAALHPTQHDFYYFVAKGDGSHQFSKTLDKHNAAVYEHKAMLIQKIILTPELPIQPDKSK